MKRQFWPTLLLTMLLALSLAGCGTLTADNTTALSNNGADAATVTETEADQPAAAADESTTQTVSATVGNAQAETLISEEDRLIDLYEMANESVVSIQVIREGGSLEGMEIFPEDHPEIDPDSPSPFDQLPDMDQIPRRSQGSGFVYDEAGRIITNNHVVTGADEILVIFADGSEAEATLVGADPDSDLAVIEVEGEDGLRPLPIGQSDDLKVGQFVAAIGNPFGLSNSMTTGIVSGLARSLPAGSQTPTGARFSIPDIIQTDAAINPGNSGGPLLNLDGEVIGVNTAIESTRGSFAGIGYAVPADTVRRVVPELIENGEVENPWLGIAGVSMNGALAEAMELDEDQRGVLIMEVVDDSPAAAADLQGSDTKVTIDGLTAEVGGDVIIGIDNQEVVEFEDLLSYIVEETEVGQTVTLEILRDGETQTVQATMEARPGNGE